MEKSSSEIVKSWGSVETLTRNELKELSFEDVAKKIYCLLEDGRSFKEIESIGHYLGVYAAHGKGCKEDFKVDVTPEQHKRILTIKRWGLEAGWVFFDMLHREIDLKKKFRAVLEHDPEKVNATISIITEN